MKEIAISIRIRHPRLTTDEITSIMKSEPDAAHPVGQPRATPTGRALEGRYPESYWLKRVDATNLHLLDAIENALKIFRAVPEASLQITREGGRIELFIGWFVDRNSGDVLPHELLKELSDRRIDLSFDVYGAELKNAGGFEPGPAKG